MGYRKKSTLYTLKWPDGHDLAGLEVTMRGVSIDTVVKFARLASDLAGQGGVLEKAAKADEVLDLVASKLVAWNLEEEDGTPVPATREAIAAQDDLPFFIEIATAWMEAVAAVDTPLPKTSPDGGSTDPTAALAASLPMEPLSPSPAT